MWIESIAVGAASGPAPASPGKGPGCADRGRVPRALRRGRSRARWKPRVPPPPRRPDRHRQWRHRARTSALENDFLDVLHALRAIGGEHLAALRGHEHVVLDANADVPEGLGHV